MRVPASTSTRRGAPPRATWRPVQPVQPVQAAIDLRPALTLLAVLTVLIILGALVAPAASAQDSDDAPRELRVVGDTDDLRVVGDTDGDVLAVGDGVRIVGTVTGDVVALGADVVIDGHVQGDALTLGGSILLTGPTSRIDGNAFALLGRVSPEGARAIGGQSRSILPPPPETGRGYLALGWSRPAILLRLLCILFWTCAALIAAFAAPSAIVHAAAETRRHPLRLAGIGTLVHASLALMLVLFVALVALYVGLPLLFLLAVAWIALEAGATASVMHAIGDRLTDSAKEPVSGYSKLLIGAFLLAMVSFIPLVGELAWLATVLVGSGAVATVRLRPPHSAHPAPTR